MVVDGADVVGGVDVVVVDGVDVVVAVGFKILEINDCNSVLPVSTDGAVTAALLSDCVPLLKGCSSMICAN